MRVFLAIVECGEAAEFGNEVYSLVARPLDFFGESSPMGLRCVNASFGVLSLVPNIEKNLCCGRGWVRSQLGFKRR